MLLPFLLSWIVRLSSGARLAKKAATRLLLWLQTKRCLSLKSRLGAFFIIIGWNSCEKWMHLGARKAGHFLSTHYCDELFSKSEHSSTNLLWAPERNFLAFLEKNWQFIRNNSNNYATDRDRFFILQFYLCGNHCTSNFLTFCTARLVSDRDTCHHRGPDKETGSGISTFFYNNNDNNNIIMTMIMIFMIYHGSLQLWEIMQTTFLHKPF